jgi:hypothetical protein
MIARTFTITAFAAALGLSACPAEATGPWGIAANGTQLNGIALEGVALDSIRMQETEEDDAEALSGCPEWICGMNGTSFNGIALKDGTLARVRFPETEVDGDDAPDSNGSSSPIVRPPPTGPSPSVRDMMLQIQASPGGVEFLKEAERRSAPIQKAMANLSTACEPPDCLEATPYKPSIGSWGNYGFHIWGQNTTWVGQVSSFWLTAPVPTEQSRFKQGTPFLVAQSYDNRPGGWHVIAFELCKANHDGRFYAGPVVGRLFHGVDSRFPSRRIPSDASLLNTWQLAIGDTPQVDCHMFPSLVELMRGDHAFVFELEMGDLLVQRVSLRKL